MPRPLTVALAGVFLAAVVAANLIIADQGPDAAPKVAFLLIGLDLVVRDLLHDRLPRRELLGLMGGLVLAGAALAYIASPDAGDIALGSSLAFAAAFTVDGLVYHALRHRPFLERSNASNLAGAVVDTIVFYEVAFGTLDGSFAQFTAKVAGGVLFALLLHRLRGR